jgi:hypothetical protein
MGAADEKRSTGRHHRDDDAPGWQRAKTTLRRSEMKRTGKTALSIDRFVKARKSTYDKRARIKESAARLAAKKAKYERLKKKLKGEFERDEGFDPEVYAKRLAAIDDPNVVTRGRGEVGTMERAVNKDKDDKDEAPPEEVKSVSGKKKSHALAKAQERAAEARRQREDERKTFLEEKAKRDAALREQRDKRRGKKELMRKKTKRGQPVMKHRVQNVLDKLHAEIGGG